VNAESSLDLNQFIRTVPDFPKPGILFYDITTLLVSPLAFREAIRRMADRFRENRIDLVAAAEARGFLFAAPLALELNAGLVPIRKKGKLPYHTMSYSYGLEYGADTVEIHRDAVPAGANVLMVDDLLATGGTMNACCKLVEQSGGKVAGCGFLIELTSLGGRKTLGSYDTFSLLQYE
jgi:adenine phosphoribosyltransferase